KLSHPENLHNRSRLVDRLLPTAILEVTVLNVRTELDVLRVKEPHRVFGAVAVEDDVDTTHPNRIEARIRHPLGTVLLLVMEQVPQAVPEVFRGDDEVRPLRTIGAPGDHPADHVDGKGITLSIVVLRLPPRILGALNASVLIDVGPVIHSSLN